jgi:uncharacterized protein (DUF427 family)
MAKAMWNGAVIAESDRTVMLEGNHYFPQDSVQTEFLRESASRTSCPWKGIASYYTLEVNGDRNDDAAWYYPDPLPAAAKIKNHVAFWKGVRISS